MINELDDIVHPLIDEVNAASNITEIGMDNAEFEYSSVLLKLKIPLLLALRTPEVMAKFR